MGGKPLARFAICREIIGHQVRGGIKMHVEHLPQRLARYMLNTARANTPAALGKSDNRLLVAAIGAAHALHPPAYTRLVSFHRAAASPELVREYRIAKRVANTVHHKP